MRLRPARDDNVFAIVFDYPTPMILEMRGTICSYRVASQVLNSVSCVVN